MVTGNVIISPDTIELEGPKRILNSLPEVIEISLPQNRITKNYQEEVEVGLDSKELIIRNPPQVNVSFTVEKFEAVDKNVSLKIINIPARYKSSIGIVKEIRCTYRLPASVVKTFSGDSILAVIDLKGMSRGNHKIVPEIKGLPQQALLLKTDTVVINF